MHSNQKRILNRIVVFFVFADCSENRNPYNFLEIDLAEQSQKRVIIELYSKVVFSEPAPDKNESDNPDYKFILYLLTELNPSSSGSIVYINPSFIR